MNIKSSIDNINRFHTTVKNKAKNLEVPNGDKITDWKSHQYMKQNLNYIQKKKCPEKHITFWHKVNYRKSK